MYPVSYEMYPSCQQLSTTLDNLGQGKKAPMSGCESWGRHGFQLSPNFILILWTYRNYTLFCFLVFDYHVMF